MKPKTNDYLGESNIGRSGVFGSNVTNTMGRSFISTHHAQESFSMGDELRKSRIQNLPNYKKTNLGDNQQMVVIFQTIEIQRLSNEVELLRMKYKEAERQIFNYQNYEVQIRELTEKCFNYESEMYEYREEIQKMNKICETLYHENQTLKSKLNEMDFSLKQKYESEKQKNQQLQAEIEKWKNRYQAGQKSKTRQLEDLKNLMECQRKSMINREIREMQIRFENERSGLENQIRKCREMINNKNHDIEDYKQKCQRYEISLMEMKQYEGQIEELEGKIALLGQQLVRLNEVLRDREDVIQNFKKNEYDLNLKLKQQKQWEYENSQLKQQLQMRMKEIQDWKLRASRFEDEAIRGKELIHFNNELTDKVNLANKENDRMNTILKAKMDEISQWKNKLQEKELEITKLKNLENEIPQYEAKSNMLKAQNDRINGILKSRLQEIENWKKRNQELESTLTKFSMLEKDKQTMEDRFNQQIKNNEELKFAYSKLEKDLNSYKKYENKCREIENSNQGLTREVDRLNNSLRNMGQELSDYRTRCSQMQQALSEFKNISSQQKDYENKVILLTQEIQRLNSLIKAKNNDIDQLEEEKLTLHSKINHYKNYEVKIAENEQIVEKLNQQNEKMRRQVESRDHKIRELNECMHDFEAKMFHTNNEKEKVSEKLRAKINEFDNLRSKFDQLENEYRQLSDLKMVCQEQHSQIAAYMADIEGLARKSKQSDAQLTKERQRVQDASKKLAAATSELQKIQRQMAGIDGQKAKEFDTLQEKFISVLKRSKQKDDQIDILMSKVSQLESKTQQLMQEYTRLLKCVEASEKQTHSLSQQILEFQDYARRISILDAEMSRLEKLNKQLEEDNKKMRLKYAGNIAMENKQIQFNLMTVMMAAEVESLRARLTERQLSMEEMRKSIIGDIRKI